MSHPGSSPDPSSSSAASVAASAAAAAASASAAAATAAAATARLEATIAALEVKVAVLEAKAAQNAVKAADPLPLPTHSAGPSRERSLAAWSDTFGRQLRDGDGAECHNARATIDSHDKQTSITLRSQLADLLQAFKLTGPGVELGVKRGEFSEEVLQKWTLTKQYYLVDPWAQQQDYVDVANVQTSEHEGFMREALARMQNFPGRYTVVRNFSFAAVHQFPDCFFDFVYVDAVHDYEGALNDLIDWWPKLRSGGIMAGHDYFDNIEPYGIFEVKSAADRFGVAVNRPLFNTLRTEGFASFWMIK